MKQVRIKDGSFPQSNSATLAGDNTKCKPKHLEWLRDDSPGGTVFFTDICLHLAPDYPATRKVAWLIEPQEINPRSYQFCVENEDAFDYILTYDAEYVDISDKWLFYLFGGSWVRPEQHKLWPKTKQVSIIASGKELTEGHRLRHEVINEFADTIDVMGRGYVPIPSKAQGLVPYRYSVVIENAKRNWWITEKLIDCFSTGTVPIYWGCNDLAQWFDTDGVIFFDTITDLKKILSSISEGYYKNRMEAIEKNLYLAKSCYCVEDWLFEHYPFLFE